MWPSSRSDRAHRSDEARRAAVALAFACACVMTGCAAEQEVAMRQPIEMGPWTFHVQRATDRTESRGGQQLKIVTIHLELHNYEERHEKPFDDFLNGRSAGSMMAFPHLRLRDEPGALFDGWLVPSSGGSLRSREWTADFVLVPSSAGGSLMGDTADLASKYLDTRIPDLSLAIDNPDRRGGQPGRVAVRLK